MWPFKPDVGKLKARGDVAALGKASRHSNAQVRAEALKALGEFGGEAAVEAIIAALADKEAGVREAALKALEAALGYETPDAVPPCLDRLTNPRAAEPLRGLLMFTVYRHPLWTQAAVRAVKRLASPPDDATRAVCAVAEQDWESAAQLGAPAVEPLLAVLGNPKADTSHLAAAADALGRIGDQRAAAPMTDLLEHDDVEVAAAAARNLQKLGAPLSHDVQAWCCIGSGDWQGLVALGGNAIQPLSTSLKRPGRNRLAIIEALGRIGGTEAAARLAKLLADPAPEPAAAAARALGGLGHIGVDAVAHLISKTLKHSPDHEVSGLLAKVRTPPELLDGLLDKGERNRRIAVKAWLLTIEALPLTGERAIPALCQALGSRAEQVRRAAAEALGELGDHQAVGPLASRLETDGDLGVFRAAFEALRRLGWASSLATLLVGLLENSQSFRRLAAAEALGELGDRQAVGPLVRRLEEDQNLAVCRAAFGALERLSWTPSLASEAAVQNLCRPLRSGAADTRRAAAAILGELGDRRAIEALAPLVADPNREVAGAALEALRRLQWDPLSLPETVLEALAGRLRDPSTAVKNATAALLAEIGDSRAVPLLMPLLTDEDLAVCRAAAEALEKLGWKPATPEARAQVAIVQGCWAEVAAQGHPAVLAIVSALLKWPSVEPPAVAALKELGLANGGDKEGALAAASAWLYSQGEAERTLDLLLAGIGEPGERRYLCSQALAKLYRAGQLSDEQKQRILAQRKSIVASKHSDVNEPPHDDEQRMLHNDGKEHDPWKPPALWRHRDYQFPASDCSHTDHLTHRDTRADVELL